jgi:uncharacterized protein
MIAVIDTNHLLRIAAAYERSPLFAAWRERRFTLVVSTPILVEIAAVIPRKKTQRFLPEDRGRWLIETLESRAVFVIPAVEFPHCRDPKDDMIIATAIAAHADYIVTTDHDLLDDADLRARLRDEWSLRIAEPAQFLAALG